MTTNFTQDTYTENDFGDLDELNEVYRFGTSTSIVGTASNVDHDGFTLDYSTKGFLHENPNPRAAAPGSTVTFSVSTSDPSLVVKVHSDASHTVDDYITLVSGSGSTSFTMPANTVTFRVSTSSNSGSYTINLSGGGSPPPPPPPGDTTPPQLVSETPNDDQMGVALNSDIVLTFSEVVRAGTGNIELRKYADNSPVAAQITFSDNKVTIHPTGGLAGDTHYYVSVPKGAITDTAANSFAGLTTNSQLDFFTALPQIITLRVRPAHDAPIQNENDPTDHQPSDYSQFAR